jgi:AraC-like DNA-binding protein
MPAAPLQPSLSATGRGPAALRYREIAPPAQLAGEIACFWSIASDGALDAPFAYLAVPDACVDVVFDLGAANDAWVYGARRAAFVERLSGAVDLFGIRVRPGRSRALLAHAGGDLAEATLQLSALSPAAAALHDAIAGARDASERAAIAARSLVSARREPCDRERAALRLVDAILAGAGALRIDDLADRAGRSPRDVTRLVRAATGLSPKRLARIARFQRSLRALVATAPPPLAILAAESGYADQAHLTNEFRDLAGRAPAALRRHCMSDSCKTRAAVPA